MISSIVPTVNLFALEIVTIALVAIIWRLIGALDQALKRQQAIQQPIAVQPSGGTDKPSPALPPPTVTGHGVAAGAVIDPGLLAFVKKEEGFKSHAYPDYKQWSIGYGTKATGPNEIITEAAADQRLQTELDVCVKFVESFIPSAPKGVKQAMADATYNLGPQWHTESLGALLANGEYEQAKTHLMEYVHAGGKVLQSLVDRRTKECAMFDNPV